MYTSILLVAMAGTQAPFATPAPEWKPDYATAAREVKTAHKPLAVFIGSGVDGWSQVSDSGKLGGEVRGILADKYVCVYIDRATPEGQKLAADLEITTDVPGLVISDSTGELQAFRHSGKLTPENLSRYLRTYGDPKRVVTQTETIGREDVRFYPAENSGVSGGYNWSSCPSCGRR